MVVCPQCNLWATGFLSSFIQLAHIEHSQSTLLRILYSTRLDRVVEPRLAGSASGACSTPERPLNQNWESSESGTQLDNFLFFGVEFVREWSGTAVLGQERIHTWSLPGSVKIAARRVIELLSDGGSVVLAKFRLNALRSTCTSHRAQGIADHAMTTCKKDTSTNSTIHTWWNCDVLMRPTWHLMMRTMCSPAFGFGLCASASFAMFIGYTIIMTFTVLHLLLCIFTVQQHVSYHIKCDEYLLRDPQRPFSHILCCSSI